VLQSELHARLSTLLGHDAMSVARIVIRQLATETLTQAGWELDLSDAAFHAKRVEPGGFDLSLLLWVIVVTPFFFLPGVLKELRGGLAILFGRPRSVDTVRATATELTLQSDDDVSSTVQTLHGTELLTLSYASSLSYCKHADRRDPALHMIGEHTTHRFAADLEDHEGRALRDLLLAHITELRAKRPELGLMADAHPAHCPYCSTLYTFGPNARCPSCGAPASRVNR